MPTALARRALKERASLCLQKAGLNEAAINAFKSNFAVLTSGKDLNIPEAAISSVSSLPKYENLKAEDASLLRERPHRAKSGVAPCAAQSRDASTAAPSRALPPSPVHKWRRSYRIRVGPPQRRR